MLECTGNTTPSLSMQRVAKMVAPKHALYIRQIAILLTAIINVSLLPIRNITRYSLSATDHFGILT